MPVIGVVASSEKDAVDSVEAVAAWEAETLVLLPGTAPSTEETLKRIDGLLVTGGEDIDPSHYHREVDPEAGVEVNPARDALELPLLQAAMERDMPVLGLCRGMQALNVVSGGSLLQDLPDHRKEQGGRGVGVEPPPHLGLAGEQAGGGAGLRRPGAGQQPPPPGAARGAAVPPSPRVRVLTGRCDYRGAGEPVPSVGGGRPVPPGVAEGASPPVPAPLRDAGAASRGVREGACRLGAPRYALNRAA